MQLCIIAPFNAHMGIIRAIIGTLTQKKGIVVEGDCVTVTEAAAMLGVRKEKIARLTKQGVLTSRPSILDARRRLIPREQLDRLLRDEGRPPRRSPSPQTAGLYTGPMEISSDRVDDYLREHWR